MTEVKRRKCWRMSCDVGEVTVRLENELCSVIGFFVTNVICQQIILVEIGGYKGIASISA